MMKKIGEYRKTELCDYHPRTNMVVLRCINSSEDQRERKEK